MKCSFYGIFLEWFHLKSQYSHAEITHAILKNDIDFIIFISADEFCQDFRFSLKYISYQSFTVILKLWQLSYTFLSVSRNIKLMIIFLKSNLTVHKSVSDLKCIFFFLHLLTGKRNLPCF